MRQLPELHFLQLTHQKMEHPDLLEISAADAERRGIGDGDRVRVFNSRGEILLTARVNGATRAGVVAARLNWAKLCVASYDKPRARLWFYGAQS